MILLIVLKFLIEILINDYDFMTKDISSLFYGFIINENLLYSIMYVILVHSSDLSYFEIAGMVIFQDVYSVVLILITILRNVSDKNLFGMKFFGILIEFFYMFTIFIYLICIGNYLYSIGILVFIAFRMKVKF